MQRERERGDNKKEAAKMKSEQIMNKEQSISSLLVAKVLYSVSVVYDPSAYRLFVDYYKTTFHV